jgi:hypothetical protein
MALMFVDRLRLLGRRKTARTASVASSVQALVDEIVIQKRPGFLIGQHIPVKRVGQRGGLLTDDFADQLLPGREFLQPAPIGGKPLALLQFIMMAC